MSHGPRKASSGYEKKGGCSLLGKGGVLGEEEEAAQLQSGQGKARSRFSHLRLEEQSEGCRSLRIQLESSCESSSNPADLLQERIALAPQLLKKKKKKLLPASKHPTLGLFPRKASPHPLAIVSL